MSLLTLLFSFQGRINRAKYWLGFLVFFIIAIAFIGFALLLGANLDTLSNTASMTYPLWASITLLSVVFFWSSLAMGVKRLHDRDVSGWWMLVFSAIGTTVSFLQDNATTPGNKIMSDVANFAVTVWIFIELGCLRGTRGPNRFGLDPLEAPPR